MIDLDDVHMALRTRALDLVVATTGAIDLAVTATGFTRTVGSFIDDKFRRGMEVTSLGFGPASNNMRGVITSLSQTDMRVSPFIISVMSGVQSITRPPLTTEASGPGRSITAGLPIMRSWENEAPVGLTAFTPVPNIPYIDEEFSPSTSRTIGVPIRLARVEDVGDYFLKWHGVPGMGSSAIRRSIGALRVRFSAGTVLSSGAYDTVIDSDPAPTTSGGIIQTGAGPVLILAIPWIVRSRNTVLA